MKIQFERKKAHNGSPFFPTKLKINRNLKTPMKKSKISSSVCRKNPSNRPTKSPLGSAGHGTRDGRGGRSGPTRGGGEGSRSRRLDYTRREGSPSGIMSSSSTAVCRLDPRARRVRFLRGAPRAHNASYCGIRGPRRNGSGWRQRRLGPA